MKCNRLGNLQTTEIYFLNFWRLGESKMKALADSVSDGGLPRFVADSFLPPLHMAAGVTQLFVASFLRALVPFTMAPCS